MNDYKETLLLGSTDFPMKARLSEREPQWLAAWEQSDLYGRLRAHCRGRPVFFLHDGPPYANGDIHIGHAVNKIIKDIILREKTLSGFDAPYLPGWDCHGMPIEIHIEKHQGRGLPVDKTIASCRRYAEKQMARQKADFKRLGVQGYWDRPYVTMSYVIESREVASFAKLLQSGSVQRGLKPVNWCLECESALAEAEVEYHTKTSTAIDVAFLVLGDLPAVWQAYQQTPLYAVIWTTTPWTIPCNQAVCLHPDLSYVLFSVYGRLCIVAEACVPHLCQRYGEGQVVSSACLGAQLSGLLLQHPLSDKSVPCVLGTHVTTDQGTGLVHTAPAHGMDDYHVACAYALPVHSLVNASGYYDADVPCVGGCHIRESEDLILSMLIDRHALLFQEKIQHAYPHCWRHKTPTIFRSTHQWFLRLDAPQESQGLSLRVAAQHALAEVSCFPDWGKERLSQMIAHRPDWCLSRQRRWGVPMTVFIHKETGELHPNTLSFFPRIIERIEAEGVAYWAAVSVSDYLPDSDQGVYEKVTDTLDVWFDSGMTHTTVVQPFLQSEGLDHEGTDLCVEGSDQHRGWFHSSLLTSVALTGKAPYRALLTHGFVVDGQGLKMSKSLGNVVSPQSVIDRFGADILRLWVASTDFAGEMIISEEVLKHSVDVYRRIRNTLRFLLANLSDFYTADAVAIEEMLSIDRYMLHMTQEVFDQVRTAYAQYRFHIAIQKIQHFASDLLGAFYLDILKDRLYTAAARSSVRRSAQTVLFHLLHVLLQMIAPVLPFTAEEAWSAYYSADQEGLFFHTWHVLPDSGLNEDSCALWALLRSLRSVVSKEVESKRSAGELGSSLQAALTLSVPEPWYSALKDYAHELHFVFMVSSCVLQATVGEARAQIEVLSVSKCARCWHYSATVGSDMRDSHICSRCIDNIYGEGEHRVFA